MPGVLHHPCPSTSCWWWSHCPQGSSAQENMTGKTDIFLSLSQSAQGPAGWAQAPRFWCAQAQQSRHWAARQTQKWKLWSSHRYGAAPGRPPHASVSQCETQTSSDSQEYIDLTCPQAIYIYTHIIEIKIFYTDRGLFVFQFQYVLFHWQPLRAESLSDGL